LKSNAVSVCPPLGFSVHILFAPTSHLSLLRPGFLSVPACLADWWLWAVPSKVWNH
jgi:hypothetical protein